MAVQCTLFSVTEADIEPSVDSLPDIADRTSRVSAAIGRPHIVELAEQWSSLHDALGAHPADHPLGFLAAGGRPFQPLADAGAGTGRYFTPSETIKMLAAIARVTEDHLMRSIAKRQLVVPAVSELIRSLVKLRIFLAEAVSSDRGVIVHHIS